MNIQKTLIVSLLCLFFISKSFAQDEHQSDTHQPDSHDTHQSEEGEKFDPSETIVHHILDTHDWHITDIPSTDENGKKVYKPIALHLPWFFYDNGFHFASGTEDLLSQGYVPYHEHVYKLKSGVEPGVDFEVDHGHVGHDFNEETMVDHDSHIIDLSLTKGSLQMIFIGILLVLLFGSIARSYKRNPESAPKGIQSLLEPIILFIRNDIAREYLGEKAEKFTPYLLSLFFFIWFSNLFGLLPFNSNIMGNISVTAGLAVITFFVVQFNGTKDYWQHVFAMPGVPGPVVPLMTLIEVISLFIKPFALAIRLFANISAGHFMILSLISLIFIMGDGGTSFSGAMGIMPISVLFTIAILTLEVVVAIIQAYIFTLLTTVFISMALETHDDHH